MKNQYIPNYAVHPGKILTEYFAARGMTQQEFASRAGIDLMEINAITACQAPITPKMALHLSQFIGHSVNFWNNLERLYEADLNRLAGLKGQVQTMNVLTLDPVGG